MINVPAGARVLLATRPIDFRKGAHSLAVLAQEALAEDPRPEEQAEKPKSDEDFKEEFEQLAKLDEEWRDYMAQSSSYSGRSQEAEDKRQFFFDLIATQETLQQHLMGQLNQTVLNGDDRIVRVDVFIQTPEG